MIEKTTQQTQKLEDGENRGATEQMESDYFVSGSRTLYEIQRGPVATQVLGNEMDDYRFLEAKRSSYGKPRRSVDYFVKVAERQEGRLAFKASGLRTHSHGLIEGYEHYRLSDVYENIRRGSREDVDIFAVRVSVIQDRERQLEFTQKFYGKFGHRAFLYLKNRYGITKGGKILCVRFNHSKGKWMVDLSAKPLARFGKHAKRFPL